MADGKNDARALRILEIMNDYNTLQRHTAALVQKYSNADPAVAQLVGYVLLRQCQQQAQQLLAKPFNPGNGIPSDLRNVPHTEVAKATLQRVIFDASARRFQAHKIYLTTAAAARWCQLREQMSKAGKLDQAMIQRLDQRLGEEVRQVKDDLVYRDLRTADQRKQYWLNDDPSLQTIQQWIQHGN